MRKFCEFDIPYNRGSLKDAFDGCKFITVQDEFSSDIITFIFSNLYVHGDMYRTIFGGVGIISAGFISVGDDETVVAYGKSISIGSPSATEEDTATISEFYLSKKNSLDKNKEENK